MPISEKISYHFIVIVLPLLFLASRMNAQIQNSPLKAFNDFFHQAEYDSAAYYIDLAITQFEAEPDSLIQAYFDKNLLIAQIQSPKAALDFNEEVGKIVNQYVDSTDHRFHYYLYTKGHYLSNAYLYKEALEVFEQYQILCNKTCDTGNSTVAMYIDIAGIYNQRKEYENAIEYCKKALNLLDEKGDSLNVKYINLYNEISYGYLIVNQLDSAKIYADKNLDKINQIYPPNHINLTMPYNILGAIEMDLQNYESSYHYFKQLENLLYAQYLETGNSRNLGFAVSNMGSLFEKTGEKGMAYDYAIKGLAYSKESYGKYISVNVIDFINLAGNASDLGMDEKAVQWIDTAYSVLEREDPDNLGLKAQIDYSKAHVLRKSEPETSVEYARKAVQYHVGSESKFTLPGMSSFYELSVSLGAVGKLDEALSYADEAVAISDSIFGPLHQNTVQMMDQRLNVLLLQNNLTSFKKGLSDLLNFFNTDLKNLSLPPYSSNMQLFETISDYIRMESCLGKISDQDVTLFMNNFERFYEQCILGYNSTFTLLDNGPLVQSIYANILEATLCMKETDNSIVFEIIDNAKSQLLRLSTNHLLATQKTDLPDQLKSRDEFLKTKVKRSAIEFGNEYNEIGTIMDYVANLKNYKIFQDSLAKLYPEYKRKFRPDHELQAYLKSNFDNDDECVLNYFSSESEWYVSYNTNGEIFLDKLDNQVVNNLSIQNLRNGKAYQDEGKLFNALLPQKVLDDQCELIIIPDGVLSALSFDMLTDESGSYLIEQKNIRYAQSLSVLKNQNELSENKSIQNNILSLVPGFTDELKSELAKDFHDSGDTLYANLLQQPFMLSLSEALHGFNRSKFLTGKDACELNLNDQNLDFKILHFGTHGIFDDQAPMFSKLVLAKDSLNDGYLHAFEILEKELDANLAILSACNTGSGRFHEGEGMLSLTYAFTYAGCPSVVLSLWNIDEKVTADILHLFYENLKSGQRKSQALRNAKLSFLNTAPLELKDPYYWAGMVLIGNDDPISFGNNFNWRYGLLAILIVAGIAIFLARRMNLSNE